MKRIYLDTCAIQRPFDDKSQLRIYLESEAVLAILRLVEDKQIEWLTSNILTLEISYISDLHRKEMVNTLLDLATAYIKSTESTKLLAKWLMSEGITALDAAHVAVALENRIDYFCTSDDKLLKKLKKSDIVKPMYCVSPLELIDELTL